MGTFKPLITCHVFVYCVARLMAYADLEYKQGESCVVSNRQLNVFVVYVIVFVLEKIWHFTCLFA